MAKKKIDYDNTIDPVTGLTGRQLRFGQFDPEQLYRETPKVDTTVEGLFTYG